MVALQLAPPAHAQTPDTTAPTLSSATGSNTTLTLTYAETLDSNATPAATAFTVEVDGSGARLSGTNPVAYTVPAREDRYSGESRRYNGLCGHYIYSS